MENLEPVVIENNEKQIESVCEKANRWKEKFGIEENSKHDFIDYLSNRFWLVRGQLIDTVHDDKKKASAVYVKSLIEESGYWEMKENVSAIYDCVVENARVADDYSYKPVTSQIIHSKGTEQIMFNTYEPPCLTEKSPTINEVKIWEDFWKYLLPEESQRNRVLQWVASLAFHPERRTCIAVLLHGASNGTGKGTLGEILMELVGRSNTAKPMNAVQSLTGRFNATLEGKVLFIVDELYEGGSFKLANGIKAKITESSLEIEPKGQEMRKIDNFCNFYATSNHLTPLWLDDKDRRWEVYSVEYQEETKAQHKIAVGSFRKWFENDREHAISVIRSHLRTINIEDYKPWSDGAMDTEAKRKLIASSTSSKEEDFEVIWHECKFDDRLMVNASDLFRTDFSNIGSAMRTAILTKLGCKKLDKSGNVSVNGIQSRNWWVTPKGLKAGIKTHMTGSEIGKQLKANHPDVKSATYDTRCGVLKVSTQMGF